MARPVVITSVPEAPEAERSRRVVTYIVMMSIRTVCFIGMIFVQDWWRLVLFLAALVLPYLSVVRANVPFAPRRAEAPIVPAPNELPDAGSHESDDDPEAKA